MTTNLFSFCWPTDALWIQERLWYLPPTVDIHNTVPFPGWEDSLFFGNLQPICIEYCSGNGAWILANAQMHPHLNWVAVERKFSRARKIWAKLKKLQLSNLFVVCGEGYQLTTSYLRDNHVEAVYVNFPDPWPKTRHAKHRLIQAPFIQQVKRILSNNGQLTLVTDDIYYSQQMISVVYQVGGFQSTFGQVDYEHDLPNYGKSYFEDLWRQKGKAIRYHRFSKL